MPFSSPLDPISEDATAAADQAEGSAKHVSFSPSTKTGIEKEDDDEVDPFALLTPTSSYDNEDDGANAHLLLPTLDSSPTSVTADAPYFGCRSAPSGKEQSAAPPAGAAAQKNDNQVYEVVGLAAVSSTDDLLYSSDEDTSANTSSSAPLFPRLHQNDDVIASYKHIIKQKDRNIMVLANRFTDVTLKLNQKEKDVVKLNSTIQELKNKNETATTVNLAQKEKDIVQLNQTIQELKDKNEAATAVERKCLAENYKLAKMATKVEAASAVEQKCLAENYKLAANLRDNKAALAAKESQVDKLQSELVHKEQQIAKLIILLKQSRGGTLRKGGSDSDESVSSTKRELSDPEYPDEKKARTVAEEVAEDEGSHERLYTQVLPSLTAAWAIVWAILILVLCVGWYRGFWTVDESETETETEIIINVKREWDDVNMWSIL